MIESGFTVRNSEDAAIFPPNASVLDCVIPSQPNTAAKLLQRVFSFPAMLAALLVGGVATIARSFFLDPDVWWHIKDGQEIIASDR